MEKKRCRRRVTGLTDSTNTSTSTRTSTRKGPRRCHYLFLLFCLAPMRVPCFRKTPLYHKQELPFMKEKKRLLISCQISPKENDALVAGQLGTMHETHPITFLKIKTHFIAFPEKCILRMNSLYEIYGRQILYQFSV